MKQFNLYIGSNNENHKVDITIIENFLNKSFDGYTIFTSDGYYKGEKENSIKVEILTDISKIQLISIVRELRFLLNQFSILTTIENKQIIEVK